MVFWLLQLWGGELELVALSRVYSRSIVVYNELRGPAGRSVEEKVFLSIQEEEKTVDELLNPVWLPRFSGIQHFDVILRCRSCWHIQMAITMTVYTVLATWTTQPSAKVSAMWWTVDPKMVHGGCIIACPKT